MPRRRTKGSGTILLNKLSNIQQFELMTWLSTQRDFHDKTGATMADILELAKKQFKFNVTANNVENALEDLGIKKKNKMAPRAEVESLKAMVDAYKIRTEQLESQAAHLRGELTKQDTRITRLEQATPIKVTPGNPPRPL